MNRNISINALTEGAIMAGITALLGVISYYIPFLSMIAFIYPLPIIILGKKRGPRVSILSTIAGGILLGFLTPILFGVQLVMIYGFLGVALGYAYYRQFHTSKSLLLGYVTSLIGMMLLLLLYNLFTGISISTELSNLMTVSMDEIIRFYQQTGIEAELLQENLKQMNAIVDSVINLLPSILLMIPAVVTVVNMLISEKILKRLGHEVISLPPFRNWKLPRHGSFGLTFIILIVMIGQSFGLDNFDIVFLNLIYLILIVFFIQGLSVISYVFHKKKVSRTMRGISLLLIFIIPLFKNILQFLGMFDVMFNFRDKL